MFTYIYILLYKSKKRFDRFAVSHTVPRPCAALAWKRWAADLHERCGTGSTYILYDIYIYFLLYTIYNV